MVALGAVIFLFDASLTDGFIVYLLVGIYMKVQESE